MQHFLLHIFSETEPHAHAEQFEGCLCNTLGKFLFLLCLARGPLNRGALGHGLVGLCLNPALFLLVRHRNLGPILHRFGDIAGFCAPEQ